MSLHLTCLPITLKACTYGSSGECSLTAEVTSGNTVDVSFGGTPGGTLNSGVTYTINGGAPLTFDVASDIGGNVVQYDVPLGDTAIQSGDVVRWLYTPGNITCGGDAIDAQDILATNSL